MGWSVNSRCLKASVSWSSSIPGERMAITARTRWMSLGRNMPLTSGLTKPHSTSSSTVRTSVRTARASSSRVIRARAASMSAVVALLDGAHLNDLVRTEAAEDRHQLTVRGDGSAAWLDHGHVAGDRLDHEHRKIEIEALAFGGVQPGSRDRIEVEGAPHERLEARLRIVIPASLPPTQKVGLDRRTPGDGHGQDGQEDGARPRHSSIIGTRTP